MMLRVTWLWIHFYVLGMIITVPVSAKDKPANIILPAPQKLAEHVYVWIGPLGGSVKRIRDTV